VTCGIRPNDVRFDAAGGIAGRLTISEKTGADKRLHLDVNGAEFVAVAPRHIEAAPGDVMRFAVDPAKIHLFDQADGTRIAA